MEKTKELTGVPGLNPEDVVVIQKLGFGSLSRLRSRVAVANMNKQGGVDAHVDLGEYMKWLVIFGVKDAPFFRGMSFDERARFVDVDGLSTETGEHLFKHIQEFNNFGGTEELKKK
jgi:hypothetical protein